MSRSAVDSRDPTAKPEPAAASGREASSLPSHCRRGVQSAVGGTIPGGAGGPGKGGRETERGQTKRLEEMDDWRLLWMLRPGSSSASYLRQVGMVPFVPVRLRCETNFEEGVLDVSDVLAIHVH